MADAAVPEERLPNGRPVAVPVVDVGRGPTLRAASSQRGSRPTRIARARRAWSITSRADDNRAGNAEPKKRDRQDDAQPVRDEGRTLRTRSPRRRGRLPSALAPTSRAQECHSGDERDRVEERAVGDELPERQRRQGGERDPAHDNPRPAPADLRAPSQTAKQTSRLGTTHRRSRSASCPTCAEAKIPTCTISPAVRAASSATVARAQRLLRRAARRPRRARAARTRESRPSSARAHPRGTG